MKDDRRRPLRWSWRVLVVVVLAGVAIHLLLPRVGELRASVTALHHARPWWLVAALLAALLSFPASAVSFIGAAARPLPLGRSTLVELAASFLNRLTPAGLGRVGLLTRYLLVNGIDGVETAGVVSLNVAAGATVHVAAMVAAAAMVRPSMIDHVSLPDRWTDLLGVVAVLVALGLAMGVILLRRRLQALRHRFVRLGAQVSAALRQPWSLLALLVGVAVVNAAMVLSLDLSLAAFGARPAFAIVALVYLAGSALASLAPTPGGLGAMEAAPVAGLTGLGVSTGPAVTGVLAFRLLSWWLPALLGGAAWAWLRRLHAL